MTLVRTFAWVAIATVAGCGGGEDDTLPPLTQATSLACPRPGALPFRTVTHQFTKPANAAIADDNPTVKDAASDSLGNPGVAGVAVNTFVADDAFVQVGPTSYAGTKARTTPDNGFAETVLDGEPVGLWTYDGGAWTQISRVVTDADGAYAEQPAAIAMNDQPVYSMLEGDLSCAEHYDERWPRGTKVIVTDIDGTLTTSDSELLMQLGDETYSPAMVTAASEVMSTWEGKGYPVIYLTARAHLYKPETRAWLKELAFPPGPVITSNATNSADVYKTAWLERMTGDFGWEIEAAYGNADTDITAYENAAIPKDHTFIVGPLGGNRGTVAILGLDFTSHLAGFVGGVAPQ